MTQTIKLITFDLDDTLWDNQPVLKTAEQKAYNKLCQLWPETEKHITKKSLKEIWQDLKKKRQDLQHQLIQLRHLSLVKALEIAGCKNKDAEMIAATVMDDFLAWRHELTLFPGVKEALSHLSKKYILGAITNGNTELEQLPIKPYMRFSIRAQDYNSSKPEPTLFLKALELTNTEANQCLHIGDCLKADIAGAQNLGMQTVWFNPRNDSLPDNIQPNHIVRSHAELPSLLEKIENTEEIVY